MHIKASSRYTNERLQEILHRYGLQKQMRHFSTEAVEDSMSRDDHLRAYVMNAAMLEELSLTHGDILPLEFGARVDMATGEYYDIQYVIFERLSTRAIWRCSTLGDGRYNLQVIQVQGDGSDIAGHICEAGGHVS